MGNTNLSGLTINGAPVQPGGGGRIDTGNVFFVDYGSGADTGKGTKDKPYKTINYAVGRCTADQGDTIYLLPGHVEDLADTSTTGALDLDVAGINVIGLGHGTLMPRIDFNHADSDFFVGADNILIENIHCSVNIPDCKVGINIDAGSDYTTIRGCKFDSTTPGTNEFFDTIQINVVSGTTIEGCKIDMGLGAGEAGIHLNGASTGCNILNNTIVGDFSDANIFGETTLSTDVYISDNLMVNGLPNGLGAVACIVLVTNSLSIITKNMMFADVATHLLICTADTCLYGDNDCSDDAGSGSTTAKVSATVVASADA